MVKHYNECHYCRCIDNNGLIHTGQIGVHAMCRDCRDSIPDYIPMEQIHNYLVRKYHGKRWFKRMSFL